MKKTRKKISKKVKTKPPVVRYTKGKYTTLMTWWCPKCKFPHTIAVRRPREKIPTIFKDPYFPVNGSTSVPSVTHTCISLLCGHNYIRRGHLTHLATDYRPGWTKPLIPVADWPEIKTKDKTPQLKSKLQRYNLKKLKTP